MFCRAKTSVLLPLVGALAASGAPLDPEQRNPAFQPGGNSRLGSPAVLRPADATVSTKRWHGSGVRKISPGAQALVRAELGGVAFAKAGDAKVGPGAVPKAGGRR
ncbi:MAG: hypothetical protein HYX71_12110 [Opitutae bacterium]|nr:hypothetical protein [Opitutae bacterium]